MYQATELILGSRGSLVRLGMRPRVLGRAGELATVTLMRAEARPMAPFNEGGAGLVLAEGLDGISTVIEKVVRGPSCQTWKDITQFSRCKKGTPARNSHRPKILRYTT